MLTSKWDTSVYGSGVEAHPTTPKNAKPIVTTQPLFATVVSVFEVTILV
jgi:hypothetical protein